MPEFNPAEFRRRLQLLSNGQDEFERLALELFAFQSSENPVYAEYLHRIGKQGLVPGTMQEIPFLPITFFKSRKILCRGYSGLVTFRSSGTGGQRSSHAICDPEFYGNHSRQLFKNAVGSIRNHEIFALLPGYEENPDSSLIYMVKELEADSAGYARFLGMDFEKLILEMEKCRFRGNKPLVFGVSHALLNLLESGIKPDFSDVLLIETGGMKGLRKEVSKTELLDTLQTGFQPEQLVSEFGMCELSSQAYAFPERFRPGFSMKLLVRQAEDPLGNSALAGRGVLNFIDLANIYSCAFIAGEDLGEVYEDGTFSVAGRLDQAEIRGCNLLFAPDSIS